MPSTHDLKVWRAILPVADSAAVCDSVAPEYRSTVDSTSHCNPAIASQKLSPATLFFKTDHVKLQVILSQLEIQDGQVSVTSKNICT